MNTQTPNEQDQQSNQPSVTPLPTEPPKNAKPTNKKPLKWLILLAAVVVAATVGYLLGSNKSSSKTSTNQQNTTMAQETTISVPKDATVTAECEAGRGKQYILPKDIPDGPIYDVHEGKVVALEYLVGLNEISSSPDKFMNLLLQNGKYDHITIMPTDPHAGFNEPHIHVIAAMMSKADMDAIKCDNSSTTTPSTHMH